MKFLITPNCLKGLDPVRQRAVFRAACSSSKKLQQRQYLSLFLRILLMAILIFFVIKPLTPAIGTFGALASFIVILLAFDEIFGRLFLIPLLEEELKNHPELRDA